MPNQIKYKKIVLAPLTCVVRSNIVRKSIMAFLNKNPQIKEIVKRVYIRYFMRFLSISNSNLPEFGFCKEQGSSETYRKIMSYVLERNRSNTDCNKEINSLILALREMDLKFLNTDLVKRNYRNLIIASYLYQLRRYPSDNDIELWCEHLKRGATLFTILNSLRLSPEFKLSGVYFIEDNK